MANDKIYIHELIEIIGANRAKYMHHMTAVWAPARHDHQQTCLGVWAEVGTTGNWPRVVNMWEHDGWDGLGWHLGYESSGKKQGQSKALGQMEPAEREWWASATEFRVGGRDGIVRPTPWTRTVEELIADGVRGAVYAHERVWTPANRCGDYVTLLEDEGLSAYRMWVVDADVVIAADDAVFVDPHTSAGQTVGRGNLGLVGHAPFSAVMRMTLLGRHERLTARRAVQLGIVTVWSRPRSCTRQPNTWRPRSREPPRRGSRGSRPRSGGCVSTVSTTVARR